MSHSSIEIMSLLGQSAAIASKAGIFGQYLIPGLLPYLYFSVCFQLMDSPHSVPSTVPHQSEHRDAKSHRRICWVCSECT